MGGPGRGHVQEVPALERVVVLCVELFVVPSPEGPRLLVNEVAPRPAAMVNLQGDVWADGEPNSAAALMVPAVHLHLPPPAQPRTPSLRCCSSGRFTAPVGNTS